MRLTITAVLLILHLFGFCQKNPGGRYRNYFGCRLELNTDSTFYFTWRFDMQASWTRGTWSLRRDTVILSRVLVYDTVVSLQTGLNTEEKIVLSDNEISDTRIETRFNTGFLSSGGQNIFPSPEKLVFRKGKLHGIRNGKLYKTKQKGFWTRKKFVPWYFREKDVN